jgi:FMN phosphatase YigB (HAD superfamily)
MKKLFIFDIDDTLIIHTNEDTNYYQNKGDFELRKLIKNSISDHNYIYTNGTYGHAEGVTNALNIRDIMRLMFARDTIPEMKPYMESFQYVQKQITRNLQWITNEYYFFDDMLDNLFTAKQLGWKTIWISHNFKKNNYDFVDYSFANIYQALIHFQKIKQV